MKFESKFGIDEVVENNTYKNGRLVGSQLYKIIAIFFDGNEIVYYVRNPETGSIVIFNERELIGDPEFDQETGYSKSKSGIIDRLEQAETTRKEGGNK